MGSENGKLYAFKAADGIEVWVFSGDGKAIRSSPLVASEGAIYFGSDDEKLHALNSSGSEKWDFVAEGMVSASPAMGFGGDIYIGTEVGKFYAVETAKRRIG